jgi:rhodanese-related sulfurtransferase
MEKIDVDTLKNWLEDPDLCIIDVRGQAAWEESAAKIRHARRFDPYAVESWGKNLPRDKKLVLY